MKHLVYAVIIMAATSVLCAAGNIYIDKTVTDTSIIISESVSCAEAGKWNEARELCSQASEIWSVKNNILGIVLNHNVSDRVSESLPSLIMLARWQEQGEFAARAAEMLAYLEHIREMELPSLSNIF